MEVMEEETTKATAATDSVDYISELPEPILHHILSFLPIKEIVRRSVLSKTWYQVWNTYTLTLEFDFFDLFSDNEDYYYNVDDLEIKKRNKQRLYDFVEEILSRRHKQMLSFNKFTLRIESVRKRSNIKSIMDRWIGYAVERHVKELKVMVATFMNNEEYAYKLPHSVLTTISIQQLILNQCKLELPCCDKVTLPYLTNLDLTVTCADDDIICKLIAGCPLLQDLTLRNCFGFKTLKIFDLLKLVNIHLEKNYDLEELKIEAPNLQLMRLQGSDVSWPSQVKLGSCMDLKSLTICKATIMDKWLHNQLNNNFPFLTFLFFEDCPMLESIKISSSRLLRLIIKSCRNLARVEIDTPKLTKFEYEGDIISFSSNHELILPKVYFYFKSESGNMDVPKYIRFVELLRKFHQFFKELNLKSKTGESYIFPRELRQILAPPLSNRKILMLSLRDSNESPHHPIAELVDAMLWLCPDLKSLSIYSMGISSSFKFQFSCRKLTTCEEEISSCCKSLPILCWQHCIEDVKIKQVFWDTAGRIRTQKNYVFTENIWEKLALLN